MNAYQENADKYEIEAFRLRKLSNRISLLRLVIFVLSVTIIVTLFHFNLVKAALIFAPISITCFGIVLKRHNKIAYLIQHTSFLKGINESEIKRDKCELEEFDTGVQFTNQSHPYTTDLDIFGQHSIFQLINRTTTESGMTLLSKWLSESAPDSEINERQKAIKELSLKFDWRQHFQATGMHFQNKQSDYNKLIEWVETPVALLKHQLVYKVVAIVLPALFFLSTYLFYVNLDSKIGVICLSFMILVIIAIYVVLRKVKPQAEYIVETSTKNLKTLRGYLALINIIENEEFSSKKLQELQSNLTKGKYSAYNETKRICNLLEFSHQRPIRKIAIGGNYFYPLLNSFFLIDIYLIIATEKWKIKNKAFLKLWINAISEFEVINSFAGFCYSNPLYTFPKITEKNCYVHFESLGHPLINSNNRICNDFQSDKYGDVIIITGSNMAGKSTFLRTVGVNIVLALAGAPCCAKNGQVSNLKLFTSMRTQDNLQNGISSFYAELNRIEKMLKLIENNQNIYFLLDEMFKGTNSEDRHKGGFSLINQLSKLKTSGIIATHDIELAKLTESRKLVTNYSFNSEMINDSMIFNYKLHNGICYDFNASQLMKKSGIEIINYI